MQVTLFANNPFKIGAGMKENQIKNAIRNFMLTMRDGISPVRKTRLDNKICYEIECIIKERNAKVIHTYIPIGSEVDISPLIRSLLTDNYTVICSKILPKRELQHFVLHSLDDLVEGIFNTKYPANSTEYKGDIDLYIVPGLAFDSNIYRLGYGTGYCDRYFSKITTGYKVGVCYPFQIIVDFPIEPHDIRLDEVVC